MLIMIMPLLFFLLPLFSPFTNAFPAVLTTRTNESDLFRSLPTELDIDTVKEVVPVEAADFFDRLTGRDKQVLRQVLAKADTYQNTSQVLQDLRNGSSTLYDKAVQVVTSIRAIVAGLNAPARTFVDESVAQLRNGLGDGVSLSNLKGQAQQLVDRYRRLDASTKEELRNAFPTVAFVLDNPIIRTMASGLFDIKTNDADNKPRGGGGESARNGKEKNGKRERGGREKDGQNDNKVIEGGKEKDSDRNDKMKWEGKVEGWTMRSVREPNDGILWNGRTNQR
uniref:Fatty acid and retinol binding protein 2 n=1 Tax=Heterodera avenae TaxID=34510 RepID=A0A1B0VAZ5_HETAV|nr:fatty acid and retinol binding protein 2 [Heterodera avenae]